MQIGIIGAGRIGGTVARQWVAAGHRVVLSFGRDSDKLSDLATALGPAARAGTPAEAVAAGPVVLFAPPWPAVPAAIAAAGGAAAFAGTIVVDTTNPFGTGGLPVPDGQAAGEVLAALLPDAHVVKAYNTLPAATLAAAPRAPGAPDRVVVFYAGDDPAAKAVVAGLIADGGLAPVDAGPLAAARRQEPGGERFTQVLTAAEVS